MDNPMYPFFRLPAALCDRPTLRNLEADYRRDPQNAAAANELGLALMGQEQHAKALYYVRKATRIQPRVAAYHYNLGRILTALEHLEDAANSYERALALQPDWPECCYTLGKLYVRRLGNTGRALELFLHAIRVDPSDYFGHVGVGRCAIQGRTADEALSYARRVASFAQNPLNVDQGVARALEHYGRYVEAWECRQRILAVSPQHLKTLNALARIADALRDQPSALRYHERAFRLDARHGESFYYHLFKLGEFERARDVYWAAKPELRALAGEDRNGHPSWNRSVWQGKTVLLDSIGGYGDSIQFARFAHLLRQCGARVIFQCQKDLCSLASTAPGIDMAVSRFDERPEVDCELVLFMETHQIIGFDIRDAMGTVPYFQPPEKTRNAWSAKLEPSTGLKVGLCWAGTGSNLHNPYAFRSIPLTELRTLMQVPGFTFFGVQKGPVLGEIARASYGVLLQNLGQDFRDLSDAAAAVLACDLIISVDTGLAHLAGALGKPTFVFVPYRGCYRWLLDRQDTFWYPTMRLFRQEKPGHWDAPIAAMVQALADFRQMRTCTNDIGNKAS
jgi:tetratricopeptide (TPR) repeat protein